jgi:hypothetical protein
MLAAPMLAAPCQANVFSTQDAIKFGNIVLRIESTRAAINDEGMKLNIVPGQVEAYACILSVQAPSERLVGYLSEMQSLVNLESSAKNADDSGAVVDNIKTTLFPVGFFPPLIESILYRNKKACSNYEVYQKINPLAEKLLNDAKEGIAMIKDKLK